MGWQDQLRDQLADPTGTLLGDWPYQYTRHLVTTTVAVARTLIDRSGHINATEVAGIAPGRLLLERAWIPDDHPWLLFAVRDAKDALPWNRTAAGCTEVGNLNDGTLQLHFPEVLDATGRPAYPRYDFASVVESWRDLPGLF